MNPQLTTPTACRQKTMYNSNETAKRAVKRRNKAAGYKYLRHYQCNVCGFWHVTSEAKADTMGIDLRLDDPEAEARA